MTTQEVLRNLSRTVAPETRLRGLMLRKLGVSVNQNKLGEFIGEHWGAIVMLGNAIHAKQRRLKK